MNIEYLLPGLIKIAKENITEVEFRENYYKELVTLMEESYTPLLHSMLDIDEVFDSLIEEIGFNGQTLIHWPEVDSYAGC